MDDSQTRRALDELADLYLTGPDPVRIDVENHRSRSPQHDAKQAQRSGAPSQELEHRPDADWHPPLIAGVMLGHLPGYATPWISQYVDSVVNEHGAAAVLRMSDDQIEVDLFCDQHIPPQTGDLRTTLEDLSSTVGAWVVIVDDVASTTARRRLAELSRWIVLSGADEMAILGAQRLIESLLNAGDVPPPSQGVGVMFMGCDESAARSGLDRLTGSVDVPLELLGNRQRMGPTRRRTVGRFTVTPGIDAWDIVGPFLAELAELEPIEDDAGPLGHIHPESNAASVSDVPPDLHQPATNGSDFATASSAASFDAVKLPPARPAKSFVEQPQPADPSLAEEFQSAAAAPATNDDALKRAADDEPERAPYSAASLAGYVNFEPLKARCPRQKDVELALDASGRLQLLVSMNGSVEQALRQLVQVRAWAVEHRELLAMTADHSQDRAILDAPPELHLFTDDPSSALDLAMGGAFKLHLLKPARGDSGESVHACLV